MFELARSSFSETEVNNITFIIYNYYDYTSTVICQNYWDISTRTITFRQSRFPYSLRILLNCSLEIADIEIAEVLKE